MKSNVPLRSCFLLFLLTCAVQGFWLSKVPRRWVEPHTRWESPAIAVSLATTGEFADPYLLPTGKTAHLPPIPPAITGLVYRTLGLTPAAGYVAWSVNILFTALLWGLLPFVAHRLGLPVPGGVLAGLAGAMIPNWSGHGESLAALSMALLTVAFAGRWMSGKRDWGRSLVLGIAAGVAFHVQPAIAAVVAGWLLYELWRFRGKGSAPVALVMLGAFLACLPWGIRNYRAFDAVFFIRSNLGLELRMGNHEGAHAAMEVMDRYEEYLHPRTHEGEARKVREAGEIAYMRRAGSEAWRWIRENPGTFMRLSASRAAHWWLGPLYNPAVTLVVAALTILAGAGGLLVFRSLPQPLRAALLIPLLCYPLIYYVVAYMPRYRQPVDWIFLLLGAATVWGWYERITAR